MQKVHTRQRQGLIHTALSLFCLILTLKVQISFYMKLLLDNAFLLRLL